MSEIDKLIGFIKTNGQVNRENGSKETNDKENDRSIFDTVKESSNDESDEFSLAKSDEELSELFSQYNYDDLSRILKYLNEYRDAKRKEQEQKVAELYNMDPEELNELIQKGIKMKVDPLGPLPEQMEIIKKMDDEYNNKVQD